MSPESEEHKRIKEIVLENLKTLYGSALKEYPASGNIHDIKAVTSDGISIFVENVWASSKSNFQRDLTILHRSTDKVKIFIVNPKIMKSESFVREFEKTRMTEREKGFQVSDMIDGSKILTEPSYVQNEFSRIVKELVGEARKKDLKSKPVKNNKNQLNHSKYILLTRSYYQGLGDWAKANLIENLLLHGNDKLETSCLMQHFETGYYDEFWSPLMEYKSLIEKYKYPTVPFPPRFQEEIGGYGKSLRDAFEMIPETDRKRLLELKEHLLNFIDSTIFEVKNGRPLKGKCKYCP